MDDWGGLLEEVAFKHNSSGERESRRKHSQVRGTHMQKPGNSAQDSERTG